MRPFLVKPAAYVKGKIVLSGDKSIAHRAIFLAAITPAKTKIKNFPVNQDCLSTARAFEKLGVKIIYNLTSITVFGVGRYGLSKPDGPIFIRDSGTTLRLILGILAGQNFRVTLTAGKSLSKRPMLRVITPLRMMGAQIKAKVKGQKSKLEEYPPITIRGGKLKPITYKMPLASAQVKSAILLAGLYANGLTRVIEPLKTRDHSERMLRLLKADIKVKPNQILIRGNRELISPGIVTVPGDISSASFFIVLTNILPDSKILLRNVGLNPSRIGVIRVLKRMGADIKVQNAKRKTQKYEPMGDLLVKSSILKGTIVKKVEIPSLIDELPVLMVASCFAKGKSIFEGVGELRVKETDRINSMMQNLNRMGADIQVNKTAKSEKIIIRGVKELKGTAVKSFADHRTAMSMVVAGLAAKGNTQIDDISCISKSFPNFLNILKKLIQ